MLERLTKRSEETTHENGICCANFLSAECHSVEGDCSAGCKWEEAAWNRLAAYEDTGMTPEVAQCAIDIIKKFVSYLKMDRDELLANLPTSWSSMYRDMIETENTKPVVRCKDCKYRDGTPGQPNIQCGNMPEDGFCSYGERKDGEA